MLQIGHVLDANGHPKAQTMSAKADAFGLYGKKKMVSGQIPNVSNGKLLFADCTDRRKTIDTSPRSLSIMSEWEKKIVKTQGRQSENKLVDRDDVFKMDPFRGVNEGTGDYKWKAEAIKRIKEHGVTYAHHDNGEPMTSSRSTSRFATRNSLGSGRLRDSGRQFLSTGILPNNASLPALSRDAKDSRIFELRRQIATLKRAE